MTKNYGQALPTQRDGRTSSGTRSVLASASRPSGGPGSPWRPGSTVSAAAGRSQRPAGHGPRTGPASGDGLPESLADW